MEDLLRCSAAAASGEKNFEDSLNTSCSLPSLSNAPSENGDFAHSSKEEISENGEFSSLQVLPQHVAMALINGRPQFDLLSDCFLAKRNSFSSHHSISIKKEENSIWN